MARLSDFPRVIKSIGWIRFFRRVLDESMRDNLMTWAAALAYSWLFAIFPFFIFLLALLPYLPTYAKARAREEIHVELKQMIPESADMIWHNINDNYLSLLYQPRGMLLYVGLGVALWAASSGISMTMSALDKCYDIERSRPFYIQRPLAILLTIVIIVLLLLVALLLPIGSIVKVWIIDIGYATRLSTPIMLFDILRWTLSVLFMMTILSIVYHMGPAIRHPYRWLSPGAVFSVIVWVVLAMAFRVYVDRIGGKGYEKTYGTVGGVAILMLFFYIDALVLLVGAEINSEIDFEILKVRRGSTDFRKPPDTSSNTVTSI
jgi:membrane protein